MPTSFEFTRQIEVVEDTPSGLDNAHEAKCRSFWFPGIGITGLKNRRIACLALKSLSPMTARPRNLSRDDEAGGPYSSSMIKAMRPLPIAHLMNLLRSVDRHRHCCVDEVMKHPSAHSLIAQTVTQRN
jgi:hypothetical protein